SVVARPLRRTLFPYTTLFRSIQKVAVWDYEDLSEMCDMDAVAAFRARALNPDHPVMRGSHENGDIFFQHREASNPYYDAVPEIVDRKSTRLNSSHVSISYAVF